MAKSAYSLSKIVPIHDVIFIIMCILRKSIAIGAFTTYFYNNRDAKKVEVT